MKRFIVPVMMLALLAVASIIAAAPAMADSDTYTFNFDKTVKPWEPYADKLPVNEHTLALKQEANGNGYAALATTGADTLWMMSSFTSKGDTVKIALQARLVEGSDFAVPVYYIGNTKPGGIGDFKKFDRTLTKKWQSFEATANVKGTVVVAIGYMTDKNNWVAFDNFAIKLSLNGNTVVSVQPVASTGSIFYRFDFQKDIKPWQPAAYKIPVNESTLTQKYEQNGNGFAALSTKEAGTLWMLNGSFPMPNPTTNGIDVRVNFHARNVLSYGTALPIVYLGTAKPASLFDFTKFDRPLTDKWQSYELKKHIGPGGLVVALGYTTDRPNWAAFDNVVVELLNP